MSRIDEIDPSTRFKCIDLFKFSVVERKTCFISLILSHFSDFFTPYYYTTNSAFWVIESHFFWYMVSNNGLERTKMQDKIVIRRGACHNLKNIDVEIPRDKLVVVTGLSGSGKSSLAFDTPLCGGSTSLCGEFVSLRSSILGKYGEAGCRCY